MDFHLGQDIELIIEDFGNSGEGIGKIGGFPFFVRDAVIGDVVKAQITGLKKSFGFAQLSGITTASPDRVPAPCPIAIPCGGCQLQELSYEKQLKFKESKLHNALQRIGNFSPHHLKTVTEPIVGMQEPFRYRNKVQVPIGTDSNGNPVAGFYTTGSRDLIPVTDCLLGTSANRQALDIILDHLKRNNIPTYNQKSGKGLIRHVVIRSGTRTGELMACLVLNCKKQASETATYLKGQQLLISKLAEVPSMTSIALNFNTSKTSLIMGNRCTIIWGQDHITDLIADAKFQISPLSFFQVNTLQAEKLYEIAAEYASLMGDETLWDLYCGTGTIGLSIGKNAGTIIGIESVPQAIKDAEKNAALNKVKNVRFHTGKVEELLPNIMAATSRSKNTVVLDPPRKGLDPSLFNALHTLNPQRIVYVSCDPATLARDLKTLTQQYGYQLARVRPVDMFPQTVHVEAVALLTLAR